MLRCIYNLHVCCFVFSRRIKQRRRAEGASTRCGPCVCLVFPILAVVGLVPCSVNSHTATGITAQVQQRSTAEESAEMSITRSGRARVVGHSHPREYSRGVQQVPYSVNSHTVQRSRAAVVGQVPWPAEIEQICRIKGVNRWCRSRGVRTME